MLYCVMKNHENGAGGKAPSGTSAYITWHPRPLVHTLGIQNSPQSRYGQLALFTLATWGEKGSFALQRFYTQIYFVFNEPFSINVILTAK